MFSSKSNRGKWTWAFVDLIVVVIGVYIAFLIQNTTSINKDRREQLKVYSALKMELETMRVGFPQFSQSNIDFLKEMREQEFFDISGWRFIEPQYGYQIIEYAINIQNTEIIDFEMYNELQKLYVGIKQLEHTERLLTELSGTYQYLISDLDENHPLNLERKANNRSRLYRFKMFLRGRAINLKRTSEKANEILLRINQLLGLELSKEIDTKFIEEMMIWRNSEEEAKEFLLEYFPDFPEEEISQIYRRVKGVTTEPQKDVSPD